MPTLLLIDDNAGVLEALGLLFEIEGFEIEKARSPEEALQLLARTPVDLVIQDMNFSADTTSGEEGVALFKQIRALDADLPIILLTAWTHLEQAIDLVKSGAADYLPKPWNDHKLSLSVRNLLELAEGKKAKAQVAAEQRRQQRELEVFDLRGLIAAAPAMRELVRLACQVARADIPVLITGPNGAGKERIAEIVHYNSRVAQGPYVAINCGALPADLLEAELFGAEAGAYTGAHRAREGRFEAADGGTLFLDEIGNLPAAGQMKLLRVLETGQFERLGASRTRQVKVRVISATNADLPAMIRAGTFREDLFYRLNVIELKIPPLRERVEDILPLAEHFLGAGLKLSDGARRALLRHPWPGNVRELRNALTRATLLQRGGVIEAADLGLPNAPGPAPASAPPAALAAHPEPALPEPGKADIEQALAAAHGVIADAATSLGLSRQALYRRMEKFGIARTAP